MTEDLIEAIVMLDGKKTLLMIDTYLEQGMDPLLLLESCRNGLTTVGEKFQSGEYYLAELLLVAKIFQKASDKLKPRFEKLNSGGNSGKIVLATMKGDIHDLGKNIFGSLLNAYGFEVIDLGVDVQPQALVEEVKTSRPDFVGLSALITTTYASMKETNDLLVQTGLRDSLRLLIGGGMTTPALKDYVGADFQCCDAMAGVNYCLAVVNQGGLNHEI